MTKTTKPEVVLEWYPHYVERWRGDERVQMLSYGEIGLYRTLLDHQWIEGSIPADEDRLARLFDKPRSPFVDLWPEVSQFFELVNGDSTRLQNPVLEEIRDEQLTKHRQHSNAGTKGAEARWGKKAKRRKTKRRVKSVDDSANGRSVTTPMAPPLANGGEGGTIGGEGKSTSQSPSRGESEGGKVTFLTPFVDAWRDEYGGELIPKGSRRGGEVGKVVSGVITAIRDSDPEMPKPEVEALARFIRWAKETEAKFANIHKWARTHGTYASKGSAKISRASKLAPRTD